MKNLKKILIVGIALFAMALTSKAQSTPVYIQMASNGGSTTQGTYQSWTFASLKYDTISNLDSNKGPMIYGRKANSVFDTVKVNGSYLSGSIQVVLTKVSGTMTDSIKLYTSDDGLHWLAAKQDTGLFSNAAGTVTYMYELPGRIKTTSSITAGGTNNLPARLPYQYYGVFIHGTTTQKAIVKAFFLGRPL